MNQDLKQHIHLPTRGLQNFRNVTRVNKGQIQFAIYTISI